MIGISLLSALVTLDGTWSKDTNKKSKIDECGHATVIGAALAETGRPVILIQWKPHPNKIILNKITPTLCNRNLKGMD